MADPRIRAVRNSNQHSPTPIQPYRHIQIDHAELLEQMLVTIDNEASAIEEMIRQLEKIETSVSQAKLNLTVSQETLMWAVTDAFKRIQRTLDEALAKYFNISINDIQRKIEISNGKKSFTVTFSERHAPGIRPPGS